MMEAKNMKKIFLIIAIISVLFLVGCKQNEYVDTDVFENTDNQNQQEIVNNSSETNENQEENLGVDFSKTISISEILLNNKLEMPSGDKEYEFELGEIELGDTKGKLSLLVKTLPVIKFNENIIHEYRTNLENATFVIFKDYIVCTDGFDFSGGTAYLYNANGEEVYDLFITHDKIKVENDVLLYSIYRGKLIEDGPQIETYARGDYELTEENGIFTETLINVDENDLYSATKIF